MARSSLQFPLSYRRLNASSSLLRCYLRLCAITYSYGFKVFFFNLSTLKILGSTLEIFLLLGLQAVKAQRWGMSNGTVCVVNRMKDYKSYCSTVHFRRITSIYQPTNAHIISHKTHLKHFKTLRHVSILSDHHQGALFLAKVILQYSQFNSYLQTFANTN